MQEIEPVVERVRRSSWRNHGRLVETTHLYLAGVPQSFAFRDGEEIDFSEVSRRALRKGFFLKWVDDFDQRVAAAE